MKILLDFDDTILDYGQTMELIFKNINEEYFKVNTSLYSIYKSIKVDDRCMDIEIRTIRKFEILCRELQSNQNPLEIFSHYTRLRKTVSIFKPGALKFLSDISIDNQVYLFSNGFSQIQSSLLKYNDIEKYFDDVYTADITGYYKPNSLYLTFVMTDIGDKKISNYCLVGNSLEEDMPYHKLGIRCFILYSKPKIISNNIFFEKNFNTISEKIDELNRGIKE